MKNIFNRQTVYMKKGLLLLLLFPFYTEDLLSQQHRLSNGLWRAAVTREDGIDIVFNLRVKGNKKIYILNDTESIEIKDIEFKKDSVKFRMPVFESYFLSVLQADGSLKGEWVKGTAGETQHWAFHARPGIPYRFTRDKSRQTRDISGKWDISLTRPSTGYTRDAMGQFREHNGKLTGTVLTPSGDYRYLEGITDADSMKLSVFDGAHAYLFVAGIGSQSNKMEGYFYSGFAGVETFSATRNENAVPPEASTTTLREGYSKLDFRFPDLAGNMISVNDERYRNKVVVVQIMGSWCPNCMDETKYFNEYYNENRSRGVEVVALAYEYSTDMERSKKSLLRFQKAFDVQYPMLITGVSISDSLRTEKTLPQITPIKVFPTTLFIGKDGHVKKIHAGFYGPGTGAYFDAFKKEFEGTVEELLKK